MHVRFAWKICLHQSGHIKTSHKIDFIEFQTIRFLIQKYFENRFRSTSGIVLFKTVLVLTRIVISNFEIEKEYEC